jgi:hypothetical protein
MTLRRKIEIEVLKHFAIKAILIFLGTAVLGYIAWIVWGCGPIIGAGDAVYQEVMDGKGCEPASFKCLQSTLLICNADHEWDELIDCTSYEPMQACCTLEGKAGCYKPEDCQK